MLVGRGIAGTRVALPPARLHLNAGAAPTRAAYRRPKVARRRPAIIRKALLVEVIGLGQHRNLAAVIKPVHAQAALVAPVGAHANAVGPEIALALVALGHEVDGALAVAVVHARKSGLVALLVVQLHPVDDVGGQVLGGHFGVVAKERLAVDQHAVHGLALGPKAAVAVYFHARQLFQQRLHGGVGLGFEGPRVEVDGIAAHANGRPLLGDHHFAQLLGEHAQAQGAHGGGWVSGRYGYGHEAGAVAQGRCLHHIVAGRHVAQGKVAVAIGDAKGDVA
jgi:hypothetical protein